MKTTLGNKINDDISSGIKGSLESPSEGRSEGEVWVVVVRRRELGRKPKTLRM